MNIEDAKLDVAKMSFEEAMKTLEELVKKLESGNESLDNAIFNYEYGNILKMHCKKKLDEAKLKVEKVIKLEDNNLSLEKFEDE